MNTQRFDEIENEVLSYISEKSHSVKDTLGFIEKHGYTSSEAENILKKIYAKHCPPKDTLY